MQCGDLGRIANAENVLSQSTRFLVDPERARAIVDAMEDQVRATWRDVARRAGVSERDCDLIAGAFAYPGFRLRAQPI
jgi:serine/threonine-protein kinase HipA